MLRIFHDNEVHWIMLILLIVSMVLHIISLNLLMKILDIKSMIDIVKTLGGL